MRATLAILALLMLLAPTTQAAATAELDQNESGWFRMWCWDTEFIYTTPGGAIGACLRYLPGRLAECLRHFCPPTPPGGEAEASTETACLYGQTYAEKTRNCLYNLMTSGGSNVRMICLDQQFQDGSVHGVTWKCVDYVVFEQVVCTEVRC